MVKRTSKIDYSLLFIALGLLVYGLIALYSASTVESYVNFGNTSHYILHQLIYGVSLGLIGMYFCSKIDYHFWQKKLPIFIFISLSLLTLVKVPGLGFSFGGATRWLHIGPILFQPAELAKIAIIFYLASWADRKKLGINNFYFGLLPSIGIIVLFSALLLWQPDFGTMLVLISIALVMLFVSGINWQYYFWTTICGILGLFAFIHFVPYRANRIKTFLNPNLDPTGAGYQIKQALIAIGAGSLWGYGYGLSRQKHNYLPEVMNDSIFAIIAEELGFIRVIVVILLFTMFAIKGFQIAKNAPDTFGRMTAFGITTWIIVQAIINIGAMTNLIPLTGIPLPFFSYGSTALIANLAAIGILLNISKSAIAK